MNFKNLNEWFSSSLTDFVNKLTPNTLVGLEKLSMKFEDFLKCISISILYDVVLISKITSNRWMYLGIIIFLQS